MTLSTQDSANLRGPHCGQNSNAEIASAITNSLKAKIGKSLFDLWFEQANSIECEEQQVTILASDPFRKSRLQTRFGSDLRAIIDQVAGPHFSITFETIAQPAETLLATDTVLSHDANALQTEPAHSPATESDVDVDSVDDPQTCFAFHEPDRRLKKKRLADSNGRYVKSYWFGDENRLARASVDQAFANPGQFSPLMFYGSTGCGKTHLLEAIVNDFRRKLRLKRCVYLSAEQFTSQFVSSLRGGSGLPMFRRKYRDLDLLAIDDVQFFCSKRATLNEFLHTVDNLARLGKQVIVSSDRPPIELDGLGADLAARLSGGLTCPLQYPGFEGRMEIVSRICKARNFKLPNDVAELIANHMTRDVRRITGAVNRLYAVSKSLNEKATMHLAQEVLADLLVFSGVGTSLVGIEQAVCDFCGVKSSELRSKSRRKKVSSARMLAMYLARQHTSSAFSEIGDHFGGRSHSTVIAAEKKVCRWIQGGENINLPNADYPAQEVIQRIESILRIG